MPEQIGDISDLISKTPSTSASAPKKPPSRIEVLEGRVATLESALETLIKELTALRESVDRLKRPKVSKATPKPDAPRDASSKPPEKPKVSKPKHKLPWDDKAIRQELEAVRPRILELLCDGNETTKQGCAEALGIDASLAGRTLSYMMTQTKEIEMISPPKTEADPDPKKIFRRKKP